MFETNRNHNLPMASQPAHPKFCNGGGPACRMGLGGDDPVTSPVTKPVTASTKITEL